MSDAFILRAGGGGGLSVNAAILHVQAPTGSTITLSKNNVVVKVLGPEKSHVNADNPANADWYYSVSSSNYGTWTVTATLSGVTGSDTVTIDSNEQYDLNVRFGLFIVKDGDLKATILSRTSGITDKVSGGRYIVSKTSSGDRVNIQYGMFDLVGKGYTKLVLVFNELSGTGDIRDTGFEIYNSPDSSSRVAAYYHAINTKYYTETTWQIDISSLPKTLSVKFGQFGNYSGTWTMKIKDFYFT